MKKKIIIFLVVFSFIFSSIPPIQVHAIYNQEAVENMERNSDYGRKGNPYTEPFANGRSTGPKNICTVEKKKVEARAGNSPSTTLKKPTQTTRKE